MGVSTNAILFYGYCWDEGLDLFAPKDKDYDEDDTSSPEWPEIILARRGTVNPFDCFPKEYESLPYVQRNVAGRRWIAEHEAKIDAWYAAKRAVQKEFGVEQDTYCSDECPIPFLFVEGSRTVVNRGARRELSPSDLDIHSDWDTKLARFLTEFNIEPPQEKPAWWLVSYWG